MNSAPDSEEAGQALIGSVLASRYRIESLLGSGGMGSVYRAEHVHMRKAVAVKVLHREMTLFPEVVARFEREAVAAARIEHPHVATATDFGRLDDGSFYLVLEFVEGKSLGATIRNLGALGEERSLRVTRQIADALAAAHNAGIVHRDLKPENVMLLERESAPDFVKVLDFGIAKLKLESSGEQQQQQLTQMGTVFGTPEYMSPEQAQGLEVDARSDLYALGILLYEMLTGSSPFHHDEIVVMLMRQITAEPPPLPDTISPAVAELTLQLLRKDPHERVQSAAEVRDRCDQLLQSVAPAAAAPELVSPPVSPTPPALVLGARDSHAELSQAHTALALPMLTRTPFAALLTLAERRGLTRPVPIAGYAVPLGVLLGLGLALLLVVGLTAMLLAVGGSDADQASGASLSGEPKPSDPDLLAVIAAAEAGDRAAIAMLAGRPLEKRALVEWRALGHGYCSITEYAACLDVYTTGLRHKPELGADPIVLGDVRQMAEREAVSAPALELAARSLGASGVDLLFDVWESGKNPTLTPAAKRARSLLDDPAVSARQSPALRAYSTFSTALKRPRCGELKKLAGELAADMDERSLPLLTRLGERRGCGFLGLSDCYSCLRSGKELTRALEAARSRPRPRFGAKPKERVGTAQKRAAGE